MTSETLKSCPFCGGEARMLGTKERWFNPACSNAECGCEWTDSYATEAEAIAAWNTRAERTCRNENGNDKYANFICSECGLHMHKPYFGRSYVDEDGKRWYGTSSEHGLHYCPNCGAKVIA